MKIGIDVTVIEFNQHIAALFYHKVIFYDKVKVEIQIDNCNMDFIRSIDGKPVKGMDPAFLTLNTHHETGICSVSVSYYNIYEILYKV